MTHVTNIGRLRGQRNPIPFIQCPDLSDPFDLCSLTIDNPEFEQHISGIHPAELQLNKANACDKETPFLDFKWLTMISIQAFTTNAMTLDFLL